ncbi:MAG: DUF4159 domain-containing protein [Hyphomicrobiaceae bacterium]
MTLGALTFMSPWLLGALAALPVIYWLLRTVPPRPRQIAFPATRILASLTNREKTPDKTPWWLMLLRMIAAALVILALAEPVLNPDRSTALNGNGPVAIVVDNGWSSAPGWGERQQLLTRVIDEAETNRRSVILIATADGATGTPVRLEAPADARRRAAALLPMPYPPDRATAGNRLAAALEGVAGASVVWLSDGLEHRDGTAFGERLVALEASDVVIALPTGTERALGLHARVGGEGRLVARIIRAGGPDAIGTAAIGPETIGIVHALSARGDRLSEARFRLGIAESEATVAFDLPLELRNQVSRVAIASHRSAGAVHLLDARSQWNRVTLISGARQEQAQPLLGPLYYLRRALTPFSEIVEPDSADASAGIRTGIARQSSVLALADIGTIPDDEVELLTAWVRRGGILIRFAGPRLEQGSDDLLPVRLREGGRALGGALSWSEPQPLAPFADDSPFAGLRIPGDVRVSRQVLADPAALDGGAEVWARLADGTPLVTARQLGDGRLVLVHVTANSDWSNLPLSGLFVEMLRRVLAASSTTPTADETTPLAQGVATSRQISAERLSVLTPTETLDGFGTLGPPPATAEAIQASAFASTSVSQRHPPGYYGVAGSGRALNLIEEGSALTALDSLPSRARALAYGSGTQTDLKPALLLAALTLLLIDVLAVLALQGAFSRGPRTGSPRPVRPTAAAFGAAVLLGALAYVVAAPNAVAASETTGAAFAQARETRPGQDQGTQRSPTEARGTAGTVGDVDIAVALAATSRVSFGYVLTGDPGIDATSRAGLEGLVKVLTARTAIEPGPPFAVDITRDEIAFFPILYWPVVETAQELPPAASAKIDAYMKGGGMIIFDTRDFGQGTPLGVGRMRGDGSTPLQRLLRRLDIPRLEPVPEGHVLTKSFYLIETFPGRYDGGQLWVEATEAAAEGSREARTADGVSSILITANDFASAWALDDENRPLFPVVPGGDRQREWAFRTGINIAMYALTGNYKADQVHIPSLLQRLGQ